MSFSRSPTSSANFAIELGVGEIAPLRDVAHQQVLEHEEVGDLLLARGEPEPRSERLHQLEPALRVVAAHALAGVVEQHPQVERERVGEILQLARELGLRVGEVSGPQRVEPLHREQRVNVDGVHMVEVVLVVRGHPPELGHHRPEHAGLVQLEQLLAPGARPREQPLELGHHRELAPGRLERRERLHHLLLRPGVDRQPLLVRDPEELEHRLGARGEQRRVAEGELAAEGLERAEAPLGDEERRGPPLRLLALGDERVRGPADRLRREVVVPHELLDREAVVRVLVAEEARHLFLEIEREPVLLAPPEVVQLVADPEQEVSRGPHRRDLRARQDRLLEQPGEPPGAEAGLGDPERALEIAQPALPGLEVRLEQEDRVAVLLPPLLELARLVRDERVGLAREQLAERPVRELGVGLRVPADEAPVEQRGADGVVLLRGARALLRGAHRPADRELAVPEQGVERLGERPHRLLARARRAEQEQVEIRVRRELAAAVATERHERDALGDPPLGAELAEHRRDEPVGGDAEQPAGRDARPARAVVGLDLRPRLGEVPLRPVEPGRGRPGRKRRELLDPRDMGERRQRRRLQRAQRGGGRGGHRLFQLADARGGFSAAWGASVAERRGPAGRSSARGAAETGQARLT